MILTRPIEIQFYLNDAFNNTISKPINISNVTINRHPYFILDFIYDNIIPDIIGISYGEIDKIKMDISLRIDGDIVNLIKESNAEILEILAISIDSITMLTGEKYQFAELESEQQQQQIIAQVKTMLMEYYNILTPTSSPSKI